MPMLNITSPPTSYIRLFIYAKSEPTAYWHWYRRRHSQCILLKIATVKISARRHCITRSSTYVAIESIYKLYMTYI